MEFMPFAHINDQAFLELFPKSGDLAYDEDGEWIYFNGEWLLTGPPVDGIPYEEYGFFAGYDTDDQDNDALHFGYGQDGPPAPLLQDPLDYPHYDYEDPRELD
jgi:hypothetical protein